MSDHDRLNSNDFVRGPFPPHGRFSIWFDNGVYIYDVAGPFNDVAMAALASMREAAAIRWPVPPGQALALVRWHGSAMMSPEAFRLLSEGYQDYARSRRTMAAVAWVGAPDTEGLDLLWFHYETLYEQIGTRFARFTEEEPARAWLRGQH
jgi:hypothetical protein